MLIYVVQPSTTTKNSKITIYSIFCFCSLGRKLCFVKMENEQKQKNETYDL